MFSFTVCHASAQGSCPETLTSVTPSTWIAGQPTIVTYTGSGFTDSGMAGCWFGNVTFDVSLVGGMPTVVANIISDSEATSTVTPDADDPTQTACVTVGNTIIGGPMLPPSAAINASAVSAAKPAAITPASCIASGGIPVQIVGNATPTITSISPSTWWASRDQKITITGTNFLKESDTGGPTQLAIYTGSGNVPLTDVKVVSRTKITAQVDPEDNTPTGPATVTVTNFASSSVPSSGTASPAPEILGIRILYQGADISDASGTPPNPPFVVGQPIKLDTDSENLPGNITVAQSKWTVGGANIGGYTPTPTSYATATVTQTVTNQTALNAFWIYPKTGVEVKYKYCVTADDIANPCSPEETATFDIVGPSAVIDPYLSLPYAIGTWYVSPQDPGCLDGNNLEYQFLSFGLLNPPASCTVTPDIPGIDFDAENISNVPAGGGNFLWVQLVTKNIVSYTEPGYAPGSQITQPGLDNSFPYNPPHANDTQQNDTPNLRMANALATDRMAFAARMYLMWKSNLDPAAIPVPIGYVDWSTSGKAKHTAKNPIWVLSKNGATTTTYRPSTDTGKDHGMPTWVHVVQNSPGTTSQGTPTDGTEEEQQ